MNNTTYSTLCRFLTRSAEIAADPAAHPSVRSMHEDVLQAPAHTYLTAYSAVPAAETLAKSARVVADQAVKALEQPYRIARSAVMGRFPSTVVPGTLKDQPTVTERKLSIVTLLGLLTDHRGEAFADELLAGAFGTNGPDTIVKLEAAAAADLALMTARSARSEAAGPAYGAFLRFKHMVRQVPGPLGAFYRALRERAVPATATPAPAPTPTPPEPPVATVSSPTNGASSHAMPSVPATTQS